MDLLDDEVFAVLTAIIVVASVFTAALIVKPSHTEPFSAIGLLDQNCKIGDYPDFVLIGENITLCTYISNHEGSPQAYMVKYKFTTPQDIPTNTTPSGARALLRRIVVLDDKQDTTFKVEIPIPYNPGMIGRNATLVFELWKFDTVKDEWVYTGKWVHLHVKVLGVPRS